MVESGNGTRSSRWRPDGGRSRLGRSVEEGQTGTVAVGSSHGPRRVVAGLLAPGRGGARIKVGARVDEEATGGRWASSRSWYGPIWREDVLPSSAACKRLELLVDPVDAGMRQNSREETGAIGAACEDRKAAEGCGEVPVESAKKAKRWSGQEDTQGRGRRRRREKKQEQQRGRCDRGEAQHLSTHDWQRQRQARGRGAVRCGAVRRAEVRALVCCAARPAAADAAAAAACR
ncbi:uncharacterized protein PSFLO_02116 [Pseudozyma flocculosa]|uniref:Uncharacterized protein n=1 Tax=Pseudozyma flocculosa TaxID=84751 RepID=A0A5C3EY01_9BASI|nr:uncharacterized protein PSFLO_02116 [Pseudozyma flocculosa]